MTQDSPAQQGTRPFRAGHGACDAAAEHHEASTWVALEELARGFGMGAAPLKVRLMRGYDGADEASTVDALLLLGEVPGPVLVEVAVAEHGAELEDGFGSVEAPAGAGDVHAVFDDSLNLEMINVGVGANRSGRV